MVIMPIVVVMTRVLVCPMAVTRQFTSHHMDTGMPQSRWLYAYVTHQCAISWLQTQKVFQNVTRGLLISNKSVTQSVMRRIINFTLRVTICKCYCSQLKCCLSNCFMWCLCVDRVMFATFKLALKELHFFVS